MKNEYLKHLSKIEFVVTDACTGRCKHCSQGEHGLGGARIEAQAAADAVRSIAAAYEIQTVMTFGGEPLLHPQAVFAVMSAATACGIPRRQVISNGYFSNSQAAVREVAARLAESGVNDLLLSVDAFHQESIPLEAVRRFAAEAVACGIPTRWQPAWLVSREDGNPYNRQTREILSALADLPIPVGEGNVIFPEGNAKRFLAAYFGNTPPVNPYEEDPRDLRCISFAANGDVLGGNFYRQALTDILEQYAPQGECL